MSFISRFRRSCRKNQIAKSNNHSFRIGRSAPSIELLESRIVPTKWSGDIFDGLGGTSGPLFTNDQVQEIIGNVHVPVGKTLTIEAGTVVKFDNGTSLNVDGTLLAPGVTGQTIIITSINDNSPEGGSNTAANGNWGNITFSNSSTGNTLNDVNIAYGGGSGNAEIIDTGNPVSITNAVVRNSSSVGVRINGASPTLTGDTFQDNNSSAISMDAASAPTIGTPTLTNNHINGVFVDSNTTIAADTDWDNPGIVYVVDGLTVAAGSTLTLGAGQDVKFLGSLSGLVVNGTIVANGTAAQPVVFTSLKDDSEGGDTNNDGSTSTPKPADWAQVRFSNTSSGDLLTNVLVSFGGTNSAGELESDGGVPSISDSTFASSSSSGIRLAGSSATLIGDTFLNNGASAVSINAASAPTIDSPTLTNNHINGVSIDTNGAITANTSWDNPGIAYVVDGLTVAAGSTLTLGAGQVVKFLGSLSGLVVNGTMVANGTAAQSVVFTSLKDDSEGGDTNNDGSVTAPKPADWAQVRFSNTISGDLLTNVLVSFGGTNSVGELESDGGVPSISDSTFANSSSSGIRLAGSSATLIGDTFLNNSASAVSINAASAPTIGAPTLTNNHINGVTVDSNTTIVADTNWNNPDIVYVVDGLTVAAGATLTLGAGQVVKFLGSLSGLVVNGAMVANGTAALPVVFTSLKDDSEGGDTNNDGSATAPKPADWAQVRFSNTSSGDLLTNVLVSFGGTNSVGELESDGGVPSISDSTFANSSSSGIRLAGSSATMAGDIFLNNSTSAISINAASAPTIGSPTLTNNHINGVSVDSNSTITANTIWDNPGIVYVVDGLTVAQGATLTLGAGQVVKFLGSLSGLVVNGTMVANGTAAQPVVFTSLKDDSEGGDTNNDGSTSTARPADWAQVRFSNTSSDDLLTNVLVSFGGTNSVGELEADGGVPFINSSTFANSSSSGVRLAGSSAVLSGDTFSNNNGSAVSMDAASDPAIIEATVTNNAVNGLSLDGNSTIQTNTTWNSPTIVYVVNGLTVGPGATLTLGAGQVVKFAGALSGLVINGTMVANGTSTQPVVFTSFKDDTEGGDTNNDGSASSPQPDDWAQIRFANTSSGDRLTNVLVSYGGTNSAGELEADGAAPAIIRSTLTNSAAAALRLVDSDATLTGDSFLNNAGPAIALDSASNIHSGGLKASGNKINGFFVDGGTVVANTTWQGQGLPYFLNGSLTVPQGVTLSIAAGTLVDGQDNTNFFGAGDIANAGTLLMTSNDHGTMQVVPTFSNTGTVEVLGGILSFAGNLINNGSGFLIGNPGATLAIAGNLGGNTTNAKGFSPSAVNVDGNGTSAAPQTLEVMSQDLGNIAQGFNENFAFYSLSVAGNTYARLVDNAPNTASGASEALYTDNLIVQSNSTLDLNGLHLYARVFQNNGTVLNGTVTILPSSGPIAENVLTASTLAAGAIADWTFFGRAGQVSTIIVNTGSSSSVVSLPPSLGFAQVTLLDPNGNVVATASNTQSGFDVILANVGLTTDGTYTVQIQAPSAQPSSAGDYDLTVGDATPQNDSLNLNQHVIGTIDNPFRIDNWTFSANAGQVVQFSLENVATSALQFSLTGPNGFTAFSNATTSSGNVTLPSSGVYQLSVDTTGQAGSYAFQLNSTSVTDLPLGTPVTETIQGSGQSTYFRVHVTQPGQIQINLQDSASGDENELYANFGSLPTRGQFHPWFFTGVSASKTLSIPTATPGDYFILVYNYVASAPGNQYTIEALAPAFTASSFTPAQVSTSASTTILVNGIFPLAYQSATVYKLQFVSPGGAVLPTTPVFLAPTGLTQTSNTTSDGSITMSAVLPANSVPAGIYTVRITDSLGNSATVAGTFAVTAGGVGLLKTSLSVPNPVGYHEPSTIYVTYTNVGSAPMSAPLLVLTATQNGVAGGFFTLQSNLAGQGFVSDTTPAGFSQSVQFLASGAIPGIIEPGETETVPIYDGGWLHSLWDFSRPPINFTLGEIDASNSGAIDWNSFTDAMRPQSINFTAWNVIAPLLTANLGSTWGQYIQTLDNDAVYLAGIGEPTNDLNQLLSFEIEKANAAYVTQSLVTTTADSLPAPGMSLTFEQSFQQSIANRYTNGMLGFGWTTNWDISATATPSGDVSIQNDGNIELFRLQPNGSYAPPPGGEGTNLTLSNGAYRLVGTNGTIYEFNADGTIDYVADTHNNRITAGYNAQEQLISLTDSNGESFALTYNAQGHLTELTDSNGLSETYSYDATGQFLTSFTNIYGTTTYSYVTGASDAQNNALSEVSYADNTHLFFSYNSQGRLTDQHQDGNQQDLSWAYLSPGGYVVTDANGNKTTILFNIFGQPGEQTDALGNVYRYTYDANLNLTKAVGPGGLTLTGTYDANGNLTSQVDPLGFTSDFTYSSSNNLTSYTDAKGNTTSYAYSSQNNLLSITYANGAQQNASYSPLGEATQYIDARGQAGTATYNSQGLVLSETFSDGESFTYTYDTRGNLLTALGAQGLITFSYANSANPDLLTKVAYPDGTFLEFAYNVVGQRTQSVDQTGFTVNYSYDSVGRLSSLTDGGGNLVVQYTYDAAGNLIQKDMGNGTRTVFTYDGLGNMTSITNFASPDGAINSFDTYTYDGLGNVLSDTNKDGAWAYAYDADSQLIQAIFTPNGSDPDGLTAQNISYTYDASGNRVSETINGVVTTYNVNNVNEYISSTTAGSGASTYQYDLDANRTATTDSNGNFTQYGYNPLNQLTSATGTNLSASYLYDPLGNLDSHTVNGVTTGYQIDPTGFGNVAFGAVVGSSVAGALTHYTYGLGLTSQVSSSGNAAYYDFSMTGNTIGITTATGTYANQYAYLPFGETITITASLANAFTYVGEGGVLADGSGLLAMGARNYDPATGQFSSTDPLGLGGGDTNTRRYVANDPVSLLDPSGQAVAADRFGGFEDTTEYQKGAGQARPVSKVAYEALTIAQGTQSTDEFHSGSGDEGNRGVDDQPRRHDEEDGSGLNRGEASSPVRSDAPTYTYPPATPTLGGTSGPVTGTIGGDPLPVLPSPVVAPMAPNPPVDVTGTTTTVGVTSHDPNAIIGPAGFGASNFIAAGTSLPYEVEFENSSTATAPAQRVDISDQLDANLDWSTFQFNGVGFGENFMAIPAGLVHFNTTMGVIENGESFDVDIDLSFNRLTGILIGSFQSIDPSTYLPPANLLTGFLPPEDGSGRGTGFVNYTITPKSGLSTGTAIRNVANIVFDQGETVTTDQVDDDDPSKGTDPNKQALVTFDGGAPTSTVTTLPGISPTSFTVSWSGQDDAGGSGIASYDVYVKVNAGAFALFQTNTTATSAAFTGVSGNTYEFYSVATDNVGNVQPTPAAAQATTEVVDGGQLQFDSATYTVNETDSTATITVARIGTDSAAVSVNYATSGGTATAGTGYTASSGTLNFAAGQSSATFTIPILDAGLVGGSQTVNLTLSSPNGGAILGSQVTAVLTIADNDSAGTLQFSAGDFTVNETDGTATITVNRTGGTTGAVTIQYATSDGSAIAGTGYSATNGTLSFAAGQSSATFTVPILDAGIVGGNQTVNLTLSSPTGGASLGSQATAVLTINDNDVAQIGQLEFSAATYGIGENAGSITITVNRTAGTAGVVTVHYATSDGTGQAGVYYQAASGDLTFQAGQTSQTFNVAVLDDMVVDGNHTVNLTLSNPGGGASLGAPSSAVLDVADADSVPTGVLALSTSATDARETAGAITLTVDRTGGSTGSITVNYSTSDGTAMSGTNYTATNGTLTFAAGVTSQTIVIPILEDHRITPYLTFTVSLTAGSGTLGAVVKTTVTIDNEDGTPNQRYIEAVYQSLLLRPADAGGLTFWSGSLDSGVARSAVAAQLTHSAEYFQTNVIKPAYQEFLNRSADQGGLNFWTQQLQAGETDEQMQAGFIASDEFFANSGGTDKSWIDALYQVLLGRQPDAGGESFWVGNLENGESRDQVANGFTGSQEGLGDRVLRTYERYLGRGASQSEIAFWVGQYGMGATNEVIVTFFIGSDEFFADSTK